MKKELEIYIHIPFCVKKCAYCDFLSFAVKDGQCGDTAALYDRYFASLQREIERWQPGQEYEVTTVFFGGGTPSVVPAEYLVRMMNVLRNKFEICREAEISMEANPGTLTKEKLAAYRTAGINRLSLGLQSADNGELGVLGRIHTWEEFLESFSLARASGFSNINVDLMSALPGQSLTSWEQSLRSVAALRPEHISAYSLIVEEGTPFYERYGAEAKKRAAGETCVLLPDEETERRMYRRTKEILQEYGYARYEISNYALPGRECRHNVGYWRRREYRGFGLGAASLVGEKRFSATDCLDAYLTGEWGAQEERTEPLSVNERMEEMMFLGLRMDAGVGLEAFFDEFGVRAQEVYADAWKKLECEGLIETNAGALRLTERGVDLANYVMAQFLLD